MKLSTWIKRSSTEDLRKLAQLSGCHSNYLYFVASNRCSAVLAKRIERATKKMDPGKVVTKQSLRPDIYD